jgi:tripartite-type tricarboxylate transporter receptor subunit TctC
LILVSATARADNYPARPITMIVPFGPGSATDTISRVIAQPLGIALKQSVVVETRQGANGGLAAAYVARAPADGYTLLTSYSAYHVGNPSLTPRLPWAQKDFTPIALVTVATNVIAAHPSVPANNLQEFIAYLKKNPGRLSYASQGNGSVSHIGTEMFKSQTGTSMVHIPYKGSGDAIRDVLSGQVQVFMTTPPSVMGHVQQGKLKGFAVTGKTRHPGLPNVPTTAEAGLKGFELESWVAIFAPAGTPPDVVDKLTTGIRQALDTPEAKTRANTAGIELRYLPPAALDAMVKTETEFWAKTIKASNITAD